MKRFSWILILLVIFSVITGCRAVPPPPPPPPSPYIFVPVTWEIVREIVNQGPVGRTIEFGELNYFLSGAINLVTNESDRTIHARAGNLVIHQRNFSMFSAD